MKTLISKVGLCVSLQGPSKLRIKNLEVSFPKDNELRIEVRAAALNFPDLLMTYGKYQYRPPIPFVVGMEGAGIVQEIGSGVTRFNIGDQVIFKGKTGACSEYVNVDEDAAEFLPSSLSYEEGAAFAVTFYTAYIALAVKGTVRPGETLLVHGAGGGVGQASVSVGKALGAIVIATASNSDKLEVAKQSGADFTINYQDNAFSDQVNDLTEGKGADVIMDPVGGWVLNESINCLSWGGRLLCVGFASGDFGNISLSGLQERGGVLMGVRAGEFSRRNPARGKQAYRELSQMIVEKKLKPWIGRRWPLDRVAEAIESMEKREIVGKQVIIINGNP